ncbi:rhsC element core protein RshC [Escherichia coli]|uniref:RhsC element core protein RshC n=1 Tax=Escherichia coli TaxID=562 RepID=A0A2X3JMZ9_ECOLX|nr:rhsC element core protein RshC [Escherichia coli]
MGGTGERSGPDIWGNPFYHQYLCVPDGKGTILVVAKTNGENQKEMVYGGQVKQVMIQKKLLAVVTSLKPIIVVWRTV